MNDAGASDSARPVGDQVALAIQSLRSGMVGGFDTLVRIDNREAEADAQFQFDAAGGILHRWGCRAIPPKAPLLGLASASPDQLTYACERCKPVPEPQPETRSADRSDVLFGLASLVDQFAGVLKERGKDYRRSSDGQRLEAQMKETYQTLGSREKEIIDVLLSTLEQAAARLRNLDVELRQTGTKGGE